MIFLGHRWKMDTASNLRIVSEQSWPRQLLSTLSHWGRVTHICVSKQTIIVSDNGLSPSRRQTIIWTNAGILLIGPLAINFSEISIEIQIFSSKKMYLKLSSAKWHLLRLGLNVLWGRDRKQALNEMAWYRTSYAQGFVVSLYCFSLINGSLWIHQTY